MDSEAEVNLKSTNALRCLALAKPLHRESPLVVIGRVVRHYRVVGAHHSPSRRARGYHATNARTRRLVHRCGHGAKTQRTVGLVNPVRNGNATLDLYCAARPSFDSDGIAWAQHIDRSAVSSLGSRVLAAIYSSAYAAQDSLETEAEYPWVFSWVWRHDRSRCAGRAPADGTSRSNCRGRDRFRFG